MIDSTQGIEVTCSHCGDVCVEEIVDSNDHVFCCNGCKMVYHLLHENGMTDYYRYEENPGISQNNISTTTYEYLDNPEIVEKLLVFRDGGISKVTFDLPQIHCSACLWLLERLSQLDEGITKSVVNFSSKKITITFQDAQTNLRKIVELLAKIGYKPTINYDQVDAISKKSNDLSIIYKIGLTGFCFGNIMLLSFPEYLGFKNASSQFYIGYINIILALPVLFYGGADYLKSAYLGIKRRDFNIDLPIALGMIALFGRSMYEILMHTGEGYLDSFAGFVFFLLIGRWFQSYTYKALDFDRNYKSYFPISTLVKEGKNWVSRSLDHIEIGDTLRIRNQELIPADGILQKGKGRIDYSFVTGEADLISKEMGEELYAGGRHQGENIEILVTKKVNQSYLTQLWNEDTFDKQRVSNSSKLLSGISKYFTYVILFLGTATMLYWFAVDSSIAIITFTSVLIVACPCALALAIPFTYGNILRLLAYEGFYLRNVETIEQVQDVDYIIFDKTGTITDPKKIEISYHGKALTEVDKIIIKSTCSHSSHPLSKAIVAELDQESLVDIDAYEDVIGSGFYAKCLGRSIKVGSSKFIFDTGEVRKEQGVFIMIDGDYIGYFKFKHALRDNIKEIMNSLKDRHRLALLSGDTDHEADRMKSLLGKDAEVFFNQTPKDKLTRIKNLQAQGRSIMMIGDGLNDAGALKQANVGVVISDESNNFSPACDGILDAGKFGQLFKYIHFLKKARFIIYGAFVLAFLYNIVGLCFAVSGNLSPVIAAILMPLSSITIILYGVVVSWAVFKKSLH